jgi:hypothetical protein
VRFIYTSDARTKDVLLEQGYALLHSNDLLWVFDNPTGADPAIAGHLYALSDTLIFEKEVVW